MERNRNKNETILNKYKSLKVGQWPSLSVGLLTLRWWRLKKACWPLIPKLYIAYFIIN